MSRWRCFSKADEKKTKKCKNIGTGCDFQASGTRCLYVGDLASVSGHFLKQVSVRLSLLTRSKAGPLDRDGEDNKE